ncbi:MAG: YMGG-like glycine zipper-containing protein [Candidatus Pedobacter colombiensis]|uniref:YMGG-like glycine zipper-containing protein n=1 Tax=Candidatus Pedobacter colombiensis TaxID=3121371 RepID=A0AAJ5WCM9_9SPHI|nr:YMGG-like glycine zipper-containing protein [Pedobacter sp.]WEK21191.1 MAG: YMGG-like glycine zipper-containing protein [Pedobacter sp.]
MRSILLVMITGMLLSACTNNAKEEALIKQKAIVAVKDSIRLDSFKRAETKAKEDEQQKLAKAKEEKVAPLSVKQATSGRSVSTSSNGKIAPAKKKGWSQSAKGAVIGGAAGAVGGALIDKKKGRGAIIGGVVGAGTGYLIGRGQDRKSGRVQPKN